MKKFLTLALALVMVLGLAAPALAYTTNTAPEQGVSPYAVRIYMVEYKDVDIFSGWITMPPSDRGYATNEVVAAVGELTVPKDANVYMDWYREIQFKTKNVNLYVTDNYASGAQGNWPWLRSTVGNTWGVLNPGGAVTDVEQNNMWKLGDDNDKLTHAIRRPVAGNATSVIPVPSSSKAFKWLVFGKVTGDDATISFVLSRGAKFAAVGAAPAIQPWNAPASSTAGGIIPEDAKAYNGNDIDAYTQALVISDKYVVFKTGTRTDKQCDYFVYENTKGFGWGRDLRNDADLAYDWTADRLTLPAVDIGNLLFRIQTINSSGKTDKMWVYPNGAVGTSYRLHVEPTATFIDVMYSADTQALPNLKVDGDQVTPNSTLYNQIIEFYNGNVADPFGLSAWNRGNLLTHSDWEKIAGAAWDISDTVDVEPWTPYVAVPENIVTDPPKTGDASVLGFVMIALAAAAAVVVKKVRA